MLPDALLRLATLQCMTQHVSILCPAELQCAPVVQEAQRLQKWAMFEQREAVRLQAKEEKAVVRRLMP